MKSLEIFKKGFRKNEVVIYAIALMLVTAGYFNYTAGLDNNVIETSSNEIINNTQKSENKIEEKNEIAVDVAKRKDKEENVIASDDIQTKEKNEAEKDDGKKDRENNNKDENIGDAKLVSNNSVVDYFVATKLERDTGYADMISTYTKILQDNSIPEPQKSIAMKEITKINNIKNAISVCENVLSTKGFENYVVLVNNDSVNVIVKVEGGLNKSKVAQIQNIVSRELNSKIENIHITEK